MVDNNSVPSFIPECHHCDQCVISFNNRTIKSILNTLLIVTREDETHAQS